MIFNEYNERKGEIVSGIIQKADKHIVVMDLGKLEGIMLPKDQIPTEQYHVNDKIKGYVVDEDNNERRSGYGAASTKNLVDVTPFNKMKVVFSNTTGYPPSMALKTSPPYDQAAFIKEHYHANTAEWDISAISGSFYVCVGDWESYNRSYTNRVTQIILTQ